MRSMEGSERQHKAPTPEESGALASSLEKKEGRSYMERLTAEEKERVAKFWGRIPPWGKNMILKALESVPEDQEEEAAAIFAEMIEVIADSEKPKAVILELVSKIAKQETIH